MPGITVELNKLEQQDKACRVFVVTGNASDKNYESLKLDLVIFQPSGVIDRRVTIDLAPVKAAGRSVKQFDFDQLACDKAASFLINGIVDCKPYAGAAGCTVPLTVKSLVSGVALTSE